MKMDTQKNMNLQNNISFLRIRPCDSDNEIYLNSRKKEGTSTFLIKSDVLVNTDNLHNKEFQTVSKDIAINSDVWMVTDENWKEFKSVHPKRLIYIFKNNFTFFYFNRNVFHNIPITIFFTYIFCY